VNNDLEVFAQIIADVVIKDFERQKKLEQFPNGFSVKEETYTCCICGHGASWYDENGMKCEACQSSIDRNEISVSIAVSKEEWYSKFELEYYFNLKGKSLNSWIKKGILKQRIMTKDKQRVHLQLFLIKDNAEMLPPKEFVQSGTIKVIENGQEWHQQIRWYNIFEPHKHLKRYRIMDYIKVNGEKLEPNTL
jgi:hypothetical protein